ncbi:LPXTG cell wall anchor domain-containing protein [Streptomyces actuosus]|uniref:LPXTG cell wall anchor domain-containing protein n=1 Tax=Streptomyces actuosus TaxID=1885 RepID=A0ABS2W221_STRAS|nr:LPXTG cell wall anchor domain-containing protein [Streptomyces actuosus]MBN0049170.1 LPXTG cell wall anchor domain-containing protein [Streptomyces actuosus]
MAFSTIPGVFAPGAFVTALLESRPVVLGHFTAAQNGSVAGTVVIPTSTVTGWHVFRLTADHPDPSVGVSIYVQGGVDETPSPTPKPPHRPPHHHPDGPGHHGRPEHGPARGAAAVVPVNDEHETPHRDGEGRSLAATGNDEALAFGGTAAALLSGGVLLVVRRRRRS